LTLFTEKSFNLADQEESAGSAAMQGKESPVGSNTQETHQYVGPYRLEKTLGKGQTGEWTVALLSLSLSLFPLKNIIAIDDGTSSARGEVISRCVIIIRRHGLTF